MALHEIFAESEAAVADGIVERYAIGVAVGVALMEHQPWPKPAQTAEVDSVIAQR